MYVNEYKFQLDNACRNLRSVLSDEYAVARKEAEYSEVIRARKEYDAYARKLRALRLA